MVLKTVCNRACQGKIDAVKQQEMAPVLLWPLFAVILRLRNTARCLLLVGSGSPRSYYPKASELASCEYNGMAWVALLHSQRFVKLKSACFLSARQLRVLVDLWLRHRVTNALTQPRGWYIHSWGSNRSSCSSTVGLFFDCFPASIKAYILYIYIYTVYIYIYIYAARAPIEIILSFCVWLVAWLVVCVTNRRRDCADKLRPIQVCIPIPIAHA